MPDYADLEIGLHRWDQDSYSIDLRYSPPRSVTDVRPLLTVSTVRFDYDRLRQLDLDPEGYGTALGEYLFGTPALYTAFAQTYASAQSLKVPLRLRLFISPDAVKLHELRWETLRNPQDGSPLLTSEQVLFSRYSMSPSFRPVYPLAREKLEAVVAIANPKDIASRRLGGRALAPLDVAGECKRALAGLDGIGAHVTLLAPAGTNGAAGNATLDQLVECLGKGCDILYLVCHGALLPVGPQPTARVEPQLWLENEQGGVDRVSGIELVTRVRELHEPPLLVVLASCQSFGTGEEAHAEDQGALAALGPRLAEAGISAVVAMQGNVTMRTVAVFMPVFFRELAYDGQIDRAMARARGAVRKRDDHWMPVLFTRLKTGQLWLRGAAEGPQFEKWRALIENIAAGECTPILGSGLFESLLGSTREIARRWADTYRFPMAPHDREDLPQVAQYLVQSEDERFPRHELTNYLRREIRRRYGDVLAAVPKWAAADALKKAPLVELISAVGAHHRRIDPSDPYAILAALPFPVYITTNPDSLLADALREAGRPPLVGIFDWQSEIQNPADPVFALNPDDQKDEHRPLVYHLFGHLSKNHTLVMTEDDYFDYLISVTKQKQIPPLISGVLAKSALLYLGFRMDDWDFRVLFRSIMGKADFSRRNPRFAHVAVQIDPEEGRVIERDLARRYLERYFAGASISIYWGKVESFLAELKQKWEERSRQDV